MGLRERFTNWILSGGHLINDNAIIVPLYKVAVGEFQLENVRSAIDAYIHDTDIFNAVNFISNAALSEGFYVTGNEDYWNGKAVDLVQDFNRTIRWGNRRGEKGLAELLRIITKELLYGGNTFIEMLTPKSLQLLNQVELSSIYKVYRNEVGDVSKIQQMIGGRINDLDPDTIIHIPWLQIDREAFGRGLIQPLIAPRTDLKGQQIPPLYKIKASLEYDIYRMIHRRGVPRSVFSFPEAGDELLTSYAAQLKDPDVDASFTTNAKVGVAVEQGGPAQGIANLITFFDKRFQAGLQTPINNLLNSSGYTEACYSEDTLTLTEEGWRYYDEIGRKDKIATFNPATKEIEYHLPQAKYVYDHDGDMIYFEDVYYDVLVTPNHAIYYRPTNDGRWRTAKASDVAKLEQFYFKIGKNDSDAVLVSKDCVKTIKYTGKVYCFTVKNHLFFTMRNGKFAIHGNSARVAEELGGLIVKDLQMRLKHAVENELYDRIILQAGLDPKKANIELHWGAKAEPDYTLIDVGNMFDRRLITVSEARKILRKIGWELEDDTGLSNATPTVTVAKSQQIAAPNSAGSELIEPVLQPQTQANAQGLVPGQVGFEQPNAMAIPKKGGS